MARKFSTSRILTPLGVIGAFLSRTEVVAGIAATKTTGYVQGGLTIFVCIFPIIVATGFFGILWAKSHVFYPPADFGSKQDVKAYVEAMQGVRENEQLLKASVEVKKLQGEVAEAPLIEEKNQEALRESDTKQLPEASTGDVSPDTPAELELEMFSAFSEKKFEDAKKFFAKLLDAETDDIKRKEYTVWRWYWGFVNGENADALKELATLAKSPEVSSLAFHLIGVVYLKSKDFDKAAAAFESSLASAAPDLRAYRLTRLADCYAQSGQTDSALSRLTKALAEFTDNSDKATIYEGIASVCEMKGDYEMRALALEMALDAKPEDSELRFKTAWSYGNHGLHDLALFHYVVDVDLNSDASGAFNNLGVEFDHFKMPINAVYNYKKSSNKKNTLAAANLAYSYMQAGFFADAKSVLDKAKSEEDVHPNVGSALAELSRLEEVETEKKKEILNRARDEQRFLKHFAESYFQIASDAFAGDWKSNRGETLSIVKSDSTIAATWQTSKDKITLSGRVTNRASKISIKSTAKATTTLFVAETKQSNGYAYTSGGGREMFWLLFDDGKPSFVSFTRSETV